MTLAQPLCATSIPSQRSFSDKQIGRPLKRDVGCEIKRNCMSRMTRLSHPVALQTVVVSLYDHERIVAVTKPQITVVRATCKWLSCVS